MGSVSLKPNGSFIGRVRMQGWPPQSKVFSRESVAHAWIADVEAAMRSGTFKINRTKGMTLGDAIDQWAEASRGRLKHFDIEQTRINKLKTFEVEIGVKTSSGEILHGRIVDLALTRIDVDHIECLVEDLIEAEYAGRTVRQYLSIISRSWTRAMRAPQGTSPIAAAQNLPPIGIDRARRLEAGEEVHLLNACEQGFGDIVKIALATTARRAEIANLEWKDVDLVRRQAIFRETKNGTTRAAPLSPDAIEILKHMSRPIHGGAVFKKSANAITRCMIRASRKARIKDLRFHDLRHEAISRLFEDTDLTDLEIMSISGHKTVQMLKRYTHLRTHKLADRLAGRSRSAE